MKVFIASVSKHGATEEIAQAVSRALSERGLTAPVRSYDTVDNWGGIDAAVLGSAVYFGHWMDPAKEFIRTYAAELSSRPVWLFSSGPLGDPPTPVEEAVDVAELLTLTGAREHRPFSGRLDRRDLGFAERAMVRAVHAAEGDFRDWHAIAAWANEIADVLATNTVSPP